MNLKVVFALALIANAGFALSLLPQETDEDFFLELSPAEVIQQEILKGQASLVHTEDEASPAHKSPANGASAKIPEIDKAHVVADPKSEVSTLKEQESDLVNNIVTKLTGISSDEAKKHEAKKLEELKQKHAGPHKSELDVLKDVEEELITKIVERLKTVHQFHPEAVITGDPWHVAQKPVPAKVIIGKPELTAQESIVAAIKKLLTEHLAPGVHTTAATHVPSGPSADHHHFTVEIGPSSSLTASQYQHANVVDFHHHLTDLINKVYLAQKANCAPNHPCYPPLPHSLVPVAQHVSDTADSLIIPAGTNLTATWEQMRQPAVTHESKPTEKHDPFAESMLKQIAAIREMEAAEEVKHKKEEAHLQQELAYQKALHLHEEQAERLADAQRLHAFLNQLSAIKSMVLGTSTSAHVLAWKTPAQLSKSAAETLADKMLTKTAPAVHFVHHDMSRSAAEALADKLLHSSNSTKTPNHPCTAPQHIEKIKDGLLKLQAEQHALQQKLWVEHYLAHQKAAPAHRATVLTEPPTNDPSVIHDPVIQPFGHR